MPRSLPALALLAPLLAALPAHAGGSVEPGEWEQAMTITAPEMPATSGNHQNDGGTLVSAHHQSNPIAAIDPNTTNARLPPSDLCGFHGRGRRGTRRPISVAAPSPAASTPQDAATMSGRDGSRSNNPSTEAG